MCMFLDCGRKLGNPEHTQPDMGITGIEPSTFLLWPEFTHHFLHLGKKKNPQPFNSFIFVHLLLNKSNVAMDTISLISYDISSLDTLKQKSTSGCFFSQVFFNALSVIPLTWLWCGDIIMWQQHILVRVHNNTCTLTVNIFKLYRVDRCVLKTASAVLTM